MRWSIGFTAAPTRWLVFAIGLGSTIATGCAEGESGPLPDLSAATFTFSAFESVAVTMNDGEGVVAGGDAEIRAGVTDWVLYDDIDEDGAMEAVVVVWASAGGEERLFEAALMEVSESREGASTWAWRASHPLGDRVRIRALTLASDVLGVHLTEHGPDDEMCCPTLESEVQLRVGDRAFTEVEGTP